MVDFSDDYFDVAFGVRVCVRLNDLLDDVDIDIFTLY